MPSPNLPHKAGSYGTNAQESTTPLLVTNPNSDVVKPDHDVPPPMPWGPLIALSLLRFAEPIALTSIFPYVPSLVEHFGVPKAEVGKWAGILASIFSLAQVFTALPWSWVSDRRGRKPILLLGMFFTVLSHLLWGLSSSWSSAAVARGVNGFFNGNTPIFRTTISELVTHPDHEALAFSINPAVYHIGASIGPLIGGAAYDPVPNTGSIFATYPALLPSIIIAVITALSMLAGWLFVPETHPVLSRRSDIGLETGNLLVYYLDRIVIYPIRRHFNRGGPINPPVRPVRKAKDDDAVFKKTKFVTLREAVTLQNSLNILVHAFMAMHSLAIAELLPVFLHQQRQNARDVGEEGPFRFDGGLGWGPAIISRYIAAAGIFTWIFQLFGYPQIGKRINKLKLYRIVMFLYPVVYLLIPFVVYFESEAARYVYIGLLWMIRCALGTIAFPSSQRIMKHSSTPGALATLNAVITITSCLGRAAGPVISGSVFSWGVKHNFAANAFLVTGGVALVAALFTIPLSEAKPTPVATPEDSGPESEQASIENGEGGNSERRPLLSHC